MREETNKRYASAVCDMNNFCTGVYELLESIELQGDLEIREVDLREDSLVYVTPKRSIWGDAYFQHKFRFDVEDLSEDVVIRLCEALENNVRQRADWWDRD